MNDVFSKRMDRFLKSAQLFVQELQSHDNLKNLKSLNYYHRIISKTTTNDEEPLAKHLVAFKSFLVPNMPAIKARNIEFVPTSIIYSDRVFIDMAYVMRKLDDEIREVCFAHLIAIDSKMTVKTKSISDNDDINRIYSRSMDIMKGADAESPGDVFNRLKESGFIEDISSDLESGKIDVVKIFQSLRETIVSKRSKVEGDPEGDAMYNALITMLDTMIEKAEKGEAVDPADLMASMASIGLS